MALSMWPESKLFEYVRCGYSSQAGCADALRLLGVSLWISAPANEGLRLAVLIGQATGMTKCFVPEGILGQSRRARSDVSSNIVGIAGRCNTGYLFTGRSDAFCLLGVWVVSKCGICENMKLYVVIGRLSSSAEPLRLQRILARCCC